MNRNLPALGIRFSIDKLEEMDSRSSYGQVAWRVLCRTEDISRFPPGTFFFEGDTAKTLNGSEYVYCLAIQLSEAGLFPKIRMAISQDADYQRVAASPQFVDDRSLCAEPFPEAGHIDIKGNLVVHQYSLLRPAFGFVRKEKRPVIDVHTDFQLPDRVKPASARTAKLPSMNSVEELETFLKSGFSQSGHSFWAVTPEELVEIVEACQHKIQAHCVDYASHFSGDPFCVVLADKESSDKGKTLALTGLFPFASAADAIAYCGFEGGIDPSAWGIRGRNAINFTAWGSHPHPSREELATGKVDLQELWRRISHRRTELNCGDGSTKKWWQFWK